jgi:uncharacterized protein (DUF2141 family)
MNDILERVCVWAVAVVLAVCVALGAASAQPAAAVVQVRAQLKGLKSDSGQAGCTIYGSPEGFPAHPEKALQRRWVPIHGRAALCEFDMLPPGSYAITAIHDENGNGKLDKSFIGKPKEGVGTSRDARSFMGPPKFEDAVLKLAAGASTVDILIHY